MANIPDAPWIRETEATGHCSRYNGAYWNYPPEEYKYDDDEEYEEDGDDGDVYFGNETSDF